MLRAFGAEWMFIDAQFGQYVDLIREAVPTLRGIVALNGDIAGCVTLDMFYLGSAPAISVDIDVKPN